MKPLVKKLSSLCARVDVLESPLDDWFVGSSPSEIAAVAEGQDGEPPRVEVPPTMDVAHQGDPYWVAPIHLYHEPFLSYR
ncbi:hypothetical protein HAX54_018183 [Datura stramonium]|uniref:Uncharacterized protein n=1 Tax=Datura stramonium TaxID=4076 RepID=A0ABS8Y4R8_DATST|nr:hypothetical protein [Datura stramonium]